jgi:hypothetical protein
MQNYQLLERMPKADNAMPGLRTREPKAAAAPGESRRIVDPEPARAPTPAPAEAAPAKRKPGRPRKVV